MESRKLWTKDFAIISISNFFLHFTFYLLIVTIAEFASNAFHATQSQAGLASGIFVIGALLSRLFAGRYINRIGWKTMLDIGFVMFLLTTCLYIPVNNLGLLLVIRFLNGTAMGIASTATGTIAQGIIPNERRGEGTGYYGLSQTIAAAAGPFLGMVISANTDFVMNFIVCINIQTIYRADIRPKR